MFLYHIMEQNSEIANAITHAWTEISSAYNQIHVEMDQVVDTGDMLNNPATRAGFAAYGKITKRSTTQIIISKLETAKFKLLRTVLNTKQRMAHHLNQQTENALFLTTQIPTVHISWLRIMQDRVLHEAFGQYLALPSPAMVPFCDPLLPHWIGRAGNEQLVEKYGDLVARAEVNGGDWIRSHEQLNGLWDDIFRKGGFYTTKEARNIFYGIVPWKFLKLYCDSILRYQRMLSSLTF